jgi:serpin B
MRDSRTFKSILPLLVALVAAPGCSSNTPVQPDHAQTTAATSSPAQTTAAGPSTATAPSQAADSPAPKATATDAQMAAAAKGDADFALSLYARVKGNDNVLLSPASARIALAMTYAGAKGATAEQMAKVLSFPNDPKTHDAFGAIAGQWQSWASAKVTSTAEVPRQPLQLRVANRLFGQKGRPFLPAFLTLLTDKYGAPLEQMDFKAAPDPSRKQINQWVEDNTEKRIKDLLPPPAVTADTRLVLVNALYFKADWEDKFEKQRTQAADFFVTPQSKVKVQMMQKARSYKYAETADAQVLEIPYFGAPVAMLVVLPKAKDGLAKLEESLTPAALAEWTGKLSQERLNLQLPKFKIESSFELHRTLAALGMTDAVDAKKADFSGMDGTKELFIGGVIQKTFCAVDEDGTEAAAATAVIARAGAAAPTAPPKDFLADHPFLFMIRDTKTGSILFMGRFVKPA